MKSIYLIINYAIYLNGLYVCPILALTFMKIQISIKVMQKRHDNFLEDNLESLLFSFKTNKRIFKGVLVLSRLPNYAPLSNFIDDRFPYEIPVISIYNFRQESLTRMLELLTNGRDSAVLQEHPLGRFKRKAS